MTYQMQIQGLGQSAYQALRLQIIANTEESGGVSLTPYADGKGFVTIGLGFNLRDQTVRTAEPSLSGLDVGSPT